MTRASSVAAVLVVLSMVAPATSHAQKSSRPPGKMTPAMCEMLGMADEYISRFRPSDGKPWPGVVESFYPAEAKLVEVYEKLIAAYEKESNSRVAFKRGAGPGGHMALLSDDLSAAINAYYTLNGKLATLDRKHMLSASKECQLRYVKGAYQRYGDKGRNAISMANAGYKIETIGLVLKRLGCKAAAVFMTNSLPTITAVFFEPSSEVARALPLKKRLTQAEYQKASPAAKLLKQL